MVNHSSELKYRRSRDLGLQKDYEANSNFDKFEHNMDDIAKVDRTQDIYSTENPTQETNQECSSTCLLIKQNKSFTFLNSYLCYLSRINILYDIKK